MEREGESRHWRGRFSVRRGRAVQALAGSVRKDEGGSAENSAVAVLDIR